MKTGTCGRIIRIMLKLKIFNLKGLTPISEKKRVLFPEQKSELKGNLNVKIMYLYDDLSYWYSKVRYSTIVQYRYHYYFHKKY